MTSSTGDARQIAVDPAANPAMASEAPDRWLPSPRWRYPAPITLAPGQSGTIIVTITPTGPAGSVVPGHLYVDTLNPVTFSGDELIDLPYAYTVG